MTIDELGRRLDAAAGELVGMRAELQRHEVAFDPAGHGAGELTASLRRVWAEQAGLAARVGTQLGELSVAVRAAAEGYRTTDREAM